MLQINYTHNYKSFKGTSISGKHYFSQPMSYCQCQSKFRRKKYFTDDLSFNLQLIVTPEILVSKYLIWGENLKGKWKFFVLRLVAKSDGKCDIPGQI